MVPVLLFFAASWAVGVADTGGNCDFDGDGHEALGCGGDDCDDADPAISAGQEDVPQDGIDQDCDGFDAAEPVMWVESGGCLPGRAGLIVVALGLRRRRR